MVAVWSTMRDRLSWCKNHNSMSKCTRCCSDIPDTPPSPTHGTPFTETTLSTQRSPTTSGALRHRVMILTPGQPIPHGRPYRYHPNGSVHMMTTRKRVRLLPIHRLDVRHSFDYSSSDHFSLDDSLRDSLLSLSSSSSSNTSSDPSSDDLPDSSSDHSLPIPSSGMRPSHLVLLFLSLELAMDLEGCSEDIFEPYVPREAGLGVNIEDESFEPS
nr:hypothetical protein [Tanacetum cinerariifolium]